MFERFTDKARRALKLAEQEARNMHHAFVGTEHILLGLLGEDEGIALEVLDELDISPDEVRAEIESLMGRETFVPTPELNFTPRAKAVLEHALEEAMQFGQSHIGTEHLLLGIVKEGQSTASQILVNLGATLDRVRATTVQVLSSSPVGAERAERARMGTGPATP